MDEPLVQTLLQAITELPEGMIVWSTISHAYTREEMIDELTERTDLAKSYCSDVIRLARDLIARKASSAQIH